MIAVRGGSGFGDALYVQSVARYLVEQGKRVEVCCNWNDIFLPLGDAVKISGFRRESIDVLAHYSTRRGAHETTQWEDVCINAKIPVETPLRLDWPAARGMLVDEVLSAASGKPIVVFGMPRPPFARSDGYGFELLPKQAAMQAVLSALSERAFVVQVGLGLPSYNLDGFGLNLINTTMVREAIDLVSVASAVVAQPSYLIPLAESLGKRGLFIWARDGRHSRHEPVRQITPRKVFHRKDLLSVVYDDASPQTIKLAVDGLCNTFRSIAAV